jgi:hypothetical protein
MKGFIYKISNADNSIIFIGSSSKMMQSYWKDVKNMYKHGCEQVNRTVRFMTISRRTELNYLVMNYLASMS